MTTNVQEAVETVASHLHPVPSYDVEGFPAPTGREEMWRFTPLRRTGGLLAGPPATATLTRSIATPTGVAVREISATEAIALGEVPPSDRPAALVALQQDAVTFIDIAADTEIDEPVTVTLHGPSADATVWGRTLIRLGERAKATIVFEHAGSARYGALTSVVVGDGANLTLVSAQLWDDDAVHLGQIGMRIGRDAHVRTFQASFGGDLVRITENVEYAAPGGELEMYGLAFVDAGQHIEHRLFIDHNEPHTKSHAVYKGGLQGQGAHSVWVGDVLIRKVAQGIETFETNRNLVLTDGCRADSVPNLEIETGDIAGAGHASATGRFDDEQLFYLQSRGIREDEARRLVVHGFFTDIVRRIGVPELERRLVAFLEVELAQHVDAPVAEDRPA